MADGANITIPNLSQLNMSILIGESPVHIVMLKKAVCPSTRDKDNSYEYAM